MGGGGGGEGCIMNGLCWNDGTGGGGDMGTILGTLNGCAGVGRSMCGGIERSKRAGKLFILRDDSIPSRDSTQCLTVSIPCSAKTAPT